MTELTDKDINDITEAAKEVNENTPNNMNSIKESTEIDENAELEIGLVETDENGNILPTSATEVDNSDVSNSIKESFDLTDDEAFQVLNVIENMDKPNYNVFDNLPQKIKDVVLGILKDNDIPMSKKNMVATAIMNEFLKEADLDGAFVDFQKSLDEALRIPSIVDMYSEHTRDVMEKNIPEMIEKIKDEEPEKAKMLGLVKDAFTKSYTFSFAINSYESNRAVRKAIRRSETEFKKCMDDFNFINNKSNFKMSDITQIPNILYNILCQEPKLLANSYKADKEEVPENIQRILDMKVTESDIQKFVILITKSCMNMDPKSVIDAAYMYYMMKNIIMLKHTKEAKTDFAAELISNICDVIAFIRNKEDEFNAASVDKPKSSKKRNNA